MSDQFWHPTPAHLRACSVAVVAITAAVLLRRPDVLVIGTPFAIVAGWSAVAAPDASVPVPSTVGRVANHTLREGEATTYAVTLSMPGEPRSTTTTQVANAGEDIVAVCAPSGWIETRPASGIVALGARSGPTVVSVDVRSTRWGRRPLPPMRIAVTSAWAALRWVGTDNDRIVTTLPLPAVFDSSAAMRVANGLVGVSRSSHPGDGSEFAGIRPFQIGDRLRRINWVRSNRTGSLHVTATWADQDRHIVLVVDASTDIGLSEGVDGRASSLDTTVRAAAAIAEHFLHRGDRVSLRIFGTAVGRRLPPATGPGQLRRILDTLSMIQPGGDRSDLGDGSRLGLPADALAIMLSPLVSRRALDRAVQLARHGLTVVVVDTLPTDLTTSDVTSSDGDETTVLAWRIRLLERRRELRIVREVGIPVIGWAGPGSLDPVLRDIARRATAPRRSARGAG